MSKTNIFFVVLMGMSFFSQMGFANAFGSDVQSVLSKTTGEWVSEAAGNDRCSMLGVWGGAQIILTHEAHGDDIRESRVQLEPRNIGDIGFLDRLLNKSGYRMVPRLPLTKGDRVIYVTTNLVGMFPAEMRPEDREHETNIHWMNTTYVELMEVTEPAPGVLDYIIVKRSKSQPGDWCTHVYEKCKITTTEKAVREALKTFPICHP